MHIPRTRREHIAFVLVILVSLFLVTSAVKCDKTVKRTQAEIDLDNSVTSKVRVNLTAASPNVRAADITINTVKLVVILGGHVRSESERALAVRIASDTEVVKDGVTQKVKQVEAKDLAIKPE